jgi:hypothetical protein
LSGITIPFTLYAHEDVQTGFEVLTSTGEKLKLAYSCWVYYVNFTEETNGKYLIVKESNGSVLEINTKNDEGPKDLVVWRILIDNFCYCIMDTLKGEWSWIKTYGGANGVTTPNEFKSIVKILTQNEDASINYEVIVDDTLFSMGNFQIEILQGSYYGKIKLILPHLTSPLSENVWIFYFGDPLAGIQNNNTLCFWNGGMDGFFYYYQKK